MAREQFTRYSASACVEMQDSGVVSIVLRGPLTGATLLQFKTQITDRFGATIAGFVADYRAALIALDGGSLDAVLKGAAIGSPMSMPMALLVPPLAADLFAGHCLRMASQGVVRRCFSAGGPALAWAQRHAARVA